MVYYYCTGPYSWDDASRSCNTLSVPFLCSPQYLNIFFWISWYFFSWWRLGFDSLTPWLIMDQCDQQTWGSIQIQNWNWLFKKIELVFINLELDFPITKFNPQINLLFNFLIQKYFFHNNPTWNINYSEYAIQVGTRVVLGVPTHGKK